LIIATLNALIKDIQQAIFKASILTKKKKKTTTISKPVV